MWATGVAGWLEKAGPESCLGACQPLLARTLGLYQTLTFGSRKCLESQQIWTFLSTLEWLGWHTSARVCRSMVELTQMILLSRVLKRGSNHSHRLWQSHTLRCYQTDSYASWLVRDQHICFEALSRPRDPQKHRYWHQFLESGCPACRPNGCPICLFSTHWPNKPSRQRTRKKRPKTWPTHWWTAHSYSRSSG